MKSTELLINQSLTILVSMMCVLLTVFDANAQTEYQYKAFESEFIAFRHGKDIGKASMFLQHGPAETIMLGYESDLSKFFFSDRRKELTKYVLNSQRFLVPFEYEYERRGTGANKSLTASFNQQNKLITINNNETIPLEEHIKDNQYFRIDIGKQLHEGLETFKYSFINYRGEQRQYSVIRMQNEALSLPYGELETIKVKVERESNKRVTYAWFAPALNFNLVRLQQFKSGKEQGDIKLRTFSFIASN